MKKRCPICKDGGRVSFKSVAIPIGREKFRTKTEKCENCGHYALTPRVRREMESWGKSLKKNIIEPQPLFTEKIHDYLDEMASNFGIKKIPLIKVMTGFYLNRIVSREDFRKLNSAARKQEGYKLLTRGKKRKVSVPVHFQTFRKLDLFSQTWNTTHAKAIEEAVLFCITILSHRKLERLKGVARRFEEFVEDFSLTA